jgi:transposase-like protein
MSMKTTRRRRSFTAEFKAQTAELVRTSSQSVAEVCRDLDLTRRPFGVGWRRPSSAPAGQTG